MVEYATSSCNFSFSYPWSFKGNEKKVLNLSDKKSLEFRKQMQKEKESNSVSVFRREWHSYIKY